MAHVHAAPRPIDVRHSTVTIFVSKSGLFSALADDHVIRAPIASGTISDTPPLEIALRIQAGDLAVVDPNLDEKKKADVRTRMLGPEVLDAAEFPTIVFESTAIEPAGDNRWTVSGRVTIRGVTRDVRFPAVRETGRYRASTILKQRDFGIQPIRVAGGTVRVKDEIRLEFDIAAADS
ncbi:MAG TPA: YceI family protein [Vicinamibacterales bacterium]